jgi:hypothetical protein
MASVVLSRLEKFTADAKAAGDSWLFLEELGPLHRRWHSIPRTARTVGFLLFHWHVVQDFKTLRLNRTMGAHADSLDDFSRGGKFEEAGWKSHMGDVADAEDLDGLLLYSEAIESWHNEAHMVIGEVTGAPMMKPRINIFYRPFWGLHLFINSKFDEQLRGYASKAKLTTKQPSSVVQSIESKHRKYVKSI